MTFFNLYNVSECVKIFVIQTRVQVFETLKKKTETKNDIKLIHKTFIYYYTVSKIIQSIEM